LRLSILGVLTMLSEMSSLLVINIMIDSGFTGCRDREGIGWTNRTNVSKF
jgi:hypothetical protein